MIYRQKPHWKNYTLHYYHKIRLFYQVPTQTGNISTRVIAGNITTRVIAGNITTRIIAGNITTSVIAGNIATRVIAGNITTRIIAGNITTSVIAGNITTSVIAGNITTHCTRVILDHFFYFIQQKHLIRFVTIAMIFYRKIPYIDNIIIKHIISRISVVTLLRVAVYV